MKSTLIIFAFLSWTSSIAQSFTLPSYQQGQYEIDTVYSYYGSFMSSGIGSIGYYLGSSLPSEFITGVDFKIVCDSTNQGGSPIHSAFRDSLGTLIPVYQGDTLDIPTSFQLFAGDIGFHIIIEGTPQISRESYLCDLGYIFTLGMDDWGMLFLENTQDTCLVDEFNGLNEITKNKNIKVFPNPFNQNTTIEFENYSNEPYSFSLYNILGKKVKTIKNINSNKFMIEKEGLPPGTYIFQLHDKYGIIANSKLMTE